MVKGVDPTSSSPRSGGHRGNRGKRSGVPPQSAVRRQSPKRDRSLGKFIIWGATFTTVITLSAALGASLALFTPFDRFASDEGGGSFSITEIFTEGFQYGIARPVNILVMGVDLNPDADPESDDPGEIFKSRSDTMMLIRLDPGSHRINLLSIPRDTRVEIPDVGLTKINHANWYGGPELASEVVSKTLNDVRIDRYVRISTGAFRELIDVVGGVEVFVPIEMRYEDKTQGLKIDLDAGQQTLTGEQAEGFSRFRNDEAGDIGRAQRQQILLKALQKKLSNPLMLTRIPQIFGVLQKYIDSDLSMGEMLALVQFGLQLKSDQLQMTLLPGRFSGPEEFEASFWIMDFAAMDKVMNTHFDVPPPDGYEQALIDNPEEDYWLRIDIQNSTEDPNAAYSMADYLLSLGYTNVHIDDDWPEQLSETAVIPQWGNIEAGERLQKLIAKSDLTVDSTGKLQSDLTIRLGEDWLQSKQAEDFIIPVDNESESWNETPSFQEDWNPQAPTVDENWSS